MNIISAALDASNPCLDVNVVLWVALADADCARFDQGGHHKLIVAVDKFIHSCAIPPTITTYNA